MLRGLTRLRLWGTASFMAPVSDYSLVPSEWELRFAEVLRDVTLNSNYQRAHRRHSCRPTNAYWCDDWKGAGDCVVICCMSSTSEKLHRRCWRTVQLCRRVHKCWNCLTMKKSRVTFYCSTTWRVEYVIRNSTTVGSVVTGIGTAVASVIHKQNKIKNWLKDRCVWCLSHWMWVSYWQLWAKLTSVNGKKEKWLFIILLPNIVR